jgi:hypothetical protein
MNVKRILAILAGVITVGSVVTMLFAFDSRYAKTEYVAQIENRLDTKIKKDRADMLQERMWRLEDRYGCDAKKTDEYRRLESERQTIMDGLRNRKDFQY